MTGKQETERVLKHSLKRKISFVAGLLVSFLIRGNLSAGCVAASPDCGPQRSVTPRHRGIFAFAADEALANERSRDLRDQGEVKDTYSADTRLRIFGKDLPHGNREEVVTSGEARADFLNRIATERSEIEALLLENEERIRELKDSYRALLRKGDNYSKPVYHSDQIFFTVFGEGHGRMKNRTRAAFAQDLALAETWLDKGYYTPDVSGMTDDLDQDYRNGKISDPRLAEEILDGGNGVIVGNGSNRTDFEIADIGTPLDREAAFQVSKVMNQDIKTPEIPAIGPAPTLPVFRDEGTTDANPGDIPMPEIRFDVEEPVTVAPEEAMPSLSDESTHLSVRIPMACVQAKAPAPGSRTDVTPELPEPAEGLRFTLNPRKPEANVNVFTLELGEAPAPPATPEPLIFAPVNLSFHGTGFEQHAGRRILQGGDSHPDDIVTVINNYEQTKPLGSVNIVMGANGTSWDQDFITNWSVNTANSATLAAGSTNETIYAFISHVEDWAATVEGEYTVTTEIGGPNVRIFASVNPYCTGKYETHKDEQKVFDFTGTLNLKAPEWNPDGVLVGLEHQLLANGGNGGDNVAAVNAPNGMTQTLKNSGTINLVEGSNMAGIMIDAEYFNGMIWGPLSSAFVGLPVTDNSAGIIHIQSGAKRSVGIDYGYYMTAGNGVYGYDTDGEGPNSTVKAGTIIVDGKDNYGIRLKDYTAEETTGQDYPFKGVNYYDLTRIEGTPGKYIEVRGDHNIGISIAQGRSQGDPTGGHGHLGSDGETDDANLIAGLNIKVGGKQNVGFYRNPAYLGANHNEMVLNGDKIADITFEPDAENSVLFRTNLDGITLQKNLALNGTGEGNTALQATATGKVTLASTYTISSKFPDFYAMTAGNFRGSRGASATNNGNITLFGAKSYGMAIAEGNEGYHQFALNNSNVPVRAKISMSGESSTGIYNEGYTEIDYATVEVTGKNGVGVYHGKNELSITVRALTFPTTVIKNLANIYARAAGAVGVYSAADGVTIENSSITAQGTNTTDGRAVGIYNAAGEIYPIGSTITVDDYGIGVYNKGVYRMDVTDGYDSTSGATTSQLLLFDPYGIGIYQAAGTLDLAGTIFAHGNYDIGLVFEDGNITSVGNFEIKTGGSYDIGLYNIGDLNETPQITLGQTNNTAIYNADRGNLAVTSDILRSTYYYDGVDLNEDMTNFTGIYNDGQLYDFSGSMNFNNGSSVALYNKGVVDDISGNIRMEGNAEGTSVGIYNEATGKIKNLSGEISVGEYATAVYNEGIMKISGAVKNSDGAESTGIYNTGRGELTLDTGAGGTDIRVGDANVGVYSDTNGGVMTMRAGTITVTGDEAAGIYFKDGGFYFEGDAKIVTSGARTAGIYHATENGSSLSVHGGSIEVTGKDDEISVGIYNKGKKSQMYYGKTEVETLGNYTVGLYNEGAVLRSDAGSIRVAGESAIGVYNAPGSYYEEDSHGGKSVAAGRKAWAVVSEDADFNSRSILEAYDGASGLYVSGGVTHQIAPTSILVENNLAKGTAGDGEGVAVYAAGGVDLNLREAEITVRNGCAIAAATGGSDGATTKINLRNANLSYTGDNYAFWSDGANGLIDLGGAEITLDGRAVGTRINDSADYGIIWDNAKIRVDSKDVILAEFLDYDGTLHMANLENDVLQALGENVEITEDSHKEFTLVRMDGGSLVLGGLMDAGGVSGTAGYNYYRRFQGERLQITADGTADIRAVLDFLKADEVFGGGNPVIGISNSGNEKSICADDTKIVLEQGARLTAARTDSSSGGTIGIYTNYGVVDVKPGAAISIQQGYGSIGGGVGIFGVNGAWVQQGGTLDVAGGSAIGILAYAYRMDGNGNTAGADFGESFDKGIFHIVNTGDITLSGPGSVGICAMNNSAGSGSEYSNAWCNLVRNTGTISVASGTGPKDMSVGIWGSETMVENQGLIETGDWGVGIYATNNSVLLCGAQGTLGTIRIGGDSIGIFAKDCLIQAPNGVEILSDDGGRDKVALYLTGDTRTRDFSFDGENTIEISLDGSGLKKAANIYLKDYAADFTYGLRRDLQMNVGEKSVGIYLAEGETPGSITAANNATIDLLSDSSGAVGMYAEEGTIANTKRINLRGEGQTGLSAEGKGVAVSNAGGVVSLDGTGGMGIRIAQGAELRDPGSIVFENGSSGNVGILVDESELNLAEFTVTGNNTGIYAKNGAVIHADHMNLLMENTSNSDYGTGIVLSGGANISGSGIAIRNDSPAENIGLYYNYDESLTLGAPLTLTGANLIGIRAGGGIDLYNNQRIFYEGSERLFGAYVAENSRYESGSTGDVIETPESVGIYAGGGTGVNSGTLAVDGDGSAAMATAGGALVNSGTIEVRKGSGVAVTGQGGCFDGQNGTIRVTGEGAVGILLRDTGPGALMNPGRITGDSDKGVGIFAENAVIEGNLDLTAFEKGVGIWAADDSIRFNQAIIKSGGIGLYLPQHHTTADGNQELVQGWTLEGVRVEAAGDGVVGIYCGNQDLIYSAETVVSDGAVGILVARGAKLTADGGVIGIEGADSLGILVDGGVADIGLTGDMRFIFGQDGGTGILVQNGGELRLGGKLSVSGNGVLSGTENGNLTNDAEIETDGAAALAARYMAGTWTIANNEAGVIRVKNGGVGMAALGSAGSADVTLTNRGRIEADGRKEGISSTGIYSESAEVKNEATISVGSDGIGIYGKNCGRGIESARIALTGPGALGIAAEGSAGSVSSESMMGADGTTGIYLKHTQTTLQAGTIALGNDSTGIRVEGGAIGNLVGDISVGDKVAATSIGIYANGGAVVGLGPHTQVAAGNGAIAIGAENATISGINPAQLSGGAGSVLLYAGEGAVFQAEGVLHAEDNIGLIARNGGSVAGLAGIRVGNKGLGAYYSMASGQVTLPDMEISGSEALGALITGGNAGTCVSVGNILFADDNGVENSIGLVSRGTANVGNSVAVGTVDVKGSENTGFYGLHTEIAAQAVRVGNSPASLELSGASVGIYVESGSAAAETVTVGENSIGIFGRDNGVAGITAKVMTVAAGGAGIVSEGAGNVRVTGDVQIAGRNLGPGAMGIYKNGGADLIETDRARWTVGEGGYGLYLTTRKGTEDEIHAENRADLILGKAAVGIYASGNVNMLNSGNITVGKTDLGAAGIHADTARHENSVAMYLTGGARAVNTGHITVDNDHSTGVYVGGNSYFENAPEGIIDVNHGGNGVLVKGEGDETGLAVNRGLIRLGSEIGDSGNGNIGLAAWSGSTIRNASQGTIQVRNGTAMYVGKGAVLDNQGLIEIQGAEGTGIAGPGILQNQGIIVLTTAGQGKVNSMGSVIEDTGGAVRIEEQSVQVGANYVSLGGTLASDAPLVLDRPILDVMSFPTLTQPVFQAPDVSGVVRLKPDFPLIGNGWDLKIENFDEVIDSAVNGKITVETSPMFVARESGGALHIVKVPYEEILLPGILDLGGKSQFHSLYAGLDNILTGDVAGKSQDALMLRRMNAWLEELFNATDLRTYNTETALAVAETRGDIYGNAQSRMQHVQRGFDAGFQEMENSYAITKDSGKYSLLHGQGHFRDETAGVPDYRYHTTGLLYMHEYEGRNYADKHGWYGGFAFSDFKFDDKRRIGNPSRERVYSLRAGIHGTKTLDADNSLRWLNRLEAGYNFHDARRTLELDRAYVNKGRFATGQLSFDTKAEKSIHRSLSSKVDLYAGVNAEWGLLEHFREDGDGLKLDVRGSNYLSIQPEIGIKGYKRFYSGEKFSVKLEGDLAYGRELGENYRSNKAKLAAGGEDSYKLIRPGQEKEILRGRAGLTFEKANKAGVALDVEVRKGTNQKNADVRFGVRFKYVFEPWG
ncbi:MAG: hypothetical protein LBQ96_05535 [Fusobacteriaceae bacterium]|nr:hypothetical protein [Fusobacteriaceae bacterium]